MEVPLYLFLSLKVLLHCAEILVYGVLKETKLLTLDHNDL